MLYQKYLVRGHIACAVFAAIAIILSFVFISGLGVRATRCDLFTSSVVWALVLDLSAMQQTVAVLTYGYRWMTSTNVDDDEDVEEESNKKRTKNNATERLWSELHPYEGDKRLV